MVEIPATIKDIAKYTGLSIATISKYLNGGNVLEKNRILIEEAIKALDFEVNEIARGLRTNKTMTIGVLIPVFEVFFNTIVSSLENVLLETGYSVIVCDYRDNEKLEKERLDFLYKKRVDALVIVPTYLKGNDIRKIIKRDIPIVAVDRPIEDFECDTILVNNFEVSYKAVERLIILGHRKIGIICGPQNIYTAQERLNGYLKAHNDYGITVYKDYIKFGEYHNMESGYKSMIELLNNPEPPSAVFVTNYEMTLGAIIAINEKDIKVPDELSIIGFDNLEMAKIVKPSLSLVVQPMEEIGETVANLLLRRLKGEKNDFPLRKKLDAQVLIRSSIKNIG
ncbi:LacI family DNA-binding transcriptional regulator [Anaerocellum danielii]|uniref:LacI family DNA-binding transcriptional regulator n=1 Tax=Anaerocellum danielii TaxID=1387557 RepID=A0ABZ0TZ15_9FIRM|nr:LacI family DNA-binding transcriptional regulator [Caldicellulosiruptor danielii]WPX08311.1 LacI family DNA-binding transcriptional regulator [Caldicellulosiruptor danielii]